MALELDHVFICCSTGAPEAGALIRLGFREGSRNVHAGQGTANRRFFFRNAYLELLWVSNVAEARSEPVRRTRLWDRWSLRDRGACPFGVVFRPTSAATTAPFETWSYQPAYLPAGLAIGLANGTSIDEPELICLPYFEGRHPAAEPVDHRVPVQKISQAVVHVPMKTTLSRPARAARDNGLLGYRAAARPLLELRFVSGREMVLDLRPSLPLLFRGAPQAGCRPQERSA